MTFPTPAGAWHPAAALTLLVAACGAAPAPTFTGSPGSPSPAAGSTKMLPARELDCTLGRITNFDPQKNQQPGDFTTEGQHRLVLFLPSVPVRTAPPPDPIDPPEPVDPRTRVTADPDGLVADMAGPFTRVVDYWPERVELVAQTTQSASKLIIVDRVDESAGSANLFLTTANDALTFDKSRLFGGACRVGTK